MVPCRIGFPHFGHLGPKIEARIANPKRPRKSAASAAKTSSSLVNSSNRSLIMLMKHINFHMTNV